MAWALLAMASFCATDWPEGVVSLIFYFLITPPECAWTTRIPRLVPDPRTWVMPVEKWGVIDRKRLWKFHVSSKVLFFWAYDEFDEALATFWGIMSDLVEEYTNPGRDLWKVLTMVSWDLAHGREPEGGEEPMEYLNSLWKMYDEELDEIWASVALTPRRIEGGGGTIGDRP